MCLGGWSKHGFVKDVDIMAVTVLAEEDGNEGILPADWDAII